jgi:glycine/D-amino acid oxidase-like deaminating enzyme
MSNLDQHVVVIGGGIVGLTTATRMLQCDPHVRVTVIEQNTVGSGASRYAGAIDIPYFQSEFHRELVSFSWKWYAEFAPAAGHRIPVPMLWYLSSADEETALRQSLNENPSEVRTCDMHWAVPPDIHVIKGSAFALRPGPWCQTLRKELELSGRAKILEHSGVTNLELRNKALRVATKDGGSISADHAIACVGPWLPAWLSAFAQPINDQKVRNKSVFGIQIEVDGSRRGWSAIGRIGAGIFFLPYGRTGNYFMSIKHDEWDVFPEKPGTIVPEVEGRAASFLDQTVGRGLWRIAEPSVFMDTYNRAFQPVVRQIQEMDDLLTVVTGTHGSGVRLSPGLANAAVRICLNS